MAAPGKEPRRLRRLLHAEPRAIADDAAACVRLASLGSADPAAELSALVAWLTGDDPRAVAWDAAVPAALLEPIASGCAVPVDDALAAALVAHRFVVGGARLTGDAATGDTGPLDRTLWRERFHPRRDALIAAVVARLDGDAAATVIERLLAEAGPDETRLHLALLQAGEAAALRSDLSPSLAARIGELLLPLAQRQVAPPLMEQAVAILGALAGRPDGDPLFDALVGRFIDSAKAVAEPARRLPKRSFLDEVQGISEGRVIKDEAFFATLGDRTLRTAAARALAQAAGLRGRGLPTVKELLARAGDDALDVVAAAYEGLAAASDDAGCLALIGPLVEDDDPATRVTGLGLLAEDPIDGPEVRALVDAALVASAPAVRAAATVAAVALGFDRARIVALVDDPALPVAVAALRELRSAGARLPSPSRLVLQAIAGQGGEGVADRLLTSLAADEDDGLDAARDQDALVAALGEWLRFAPEAARWVAAHAPDPGALLLIAGAAGQPRDDEGPPALLRRPDAEAAALLAALEPALHAEVDSALAAAFAIGALVPNYPAALEALERAWAHQHLPDEPSLVITLLGQMWVRDPRATRRLLAALRRADVANQVLGVVALALVATDEAEVVAAIDEVAGYGTAGATAWWQALTVLARARPALLDGR